VKSSSPTNDGIGRAAGALTVWFGRNARDLPWRRTLDPYGIWVSEIMLQQTQVRTVVPYWERWMRRLPTVAALARSRETTVLKLWEGLGYYSRVRNLRKAAQMVMEEHDGRFPDDPVAIRSLPGIGRYTGGAIASIAFNLPEPILDGNVIRVLSRVFAIGGNPKDKAVNERLWSQSAEMVEAAPGGTGPRDASPMVFAGQRSELNQGMMELGATVCLPQAPKCGQCPLESHCEAVRLGRVDAYPAIPPRVTVTPREFHTFALRHQGRYLVRQRPVGEVNAGFWEFPGVELRAMERPEESFVRLFGSPAPALKRLAVLRHSITRFRYQQHVFAGDWPIAAPEAVPGRWETPEELRRRPFYSAQRRLLKLLD
jgi:A/G-specific adenine glycosylase